MASRAASLTNSAGADLWRGLVRTYDRLEATRRGYVWLSKLGPAYLFGLVAAVKAWGLGGTVGALLDGGAGLELGLLTAYQLMSFAFFTLVAVLFAARKRPVRRVGNRLQGVVALLGSYVMSPVAFSGSTVHDPAVLIAADVLMVVGMGGAALALASLGRCFGIFPEARGLVTHGLYRFVRHPMYLFEFVAFLGILLPALTAVNALLYAAFVVFQLGRIHFEEQTLAEAFPNEYPVYRERTARLIPGLY